MKKSKKTGTLGAFEILRESSKKYVVWDVEMNEDLRVSMEKIGREEAEKDTSIFVNVGFCKTLERVVQQKTTNKKKKA